MKKFFSTVISDINPLKGTIQNSLRNTTIVSKEGLENKMRIERLLKNPQFGKPISAEEMKEMEILQEETSERDKKFSAY